MITLVFKGQQTSINQSLCVCAYNSQTSFNNAAVHLLPASVNRPGRPVFRLVSFFNCVVIGRWVTVHFCLPYPVMRTSARSVELMRWMTRLSYSMSAVRTRSSANAEEPSEHTVSWKIVQNAAQMYDGLHLKRPATGHQGHSRSLPLLPFDRPYTISY